MNKLLTIFTPCLIGFLAGQKWPKVAQTADVSDFILKNTRFVPTRIFF